MSTEARLKHQAGLTARQLRDDSDIHDLLTAHYRGYIDLRLPCPYPPGTREKKGIMAARYVIGSPLNVVGDQRDWGNYR